MRDRVLGAEVDREEPVTLMELLGEDDVHPELVALLTACSECPTDQTAKLVTADWAAERDMPKLEYLLRFLAEDDAFQHGDPILFTGSRRYGLPRPNSDFDWVWFNHTGDARIELCRHAKERLTQETKSDGPPYDGSSLWDAVRFGPVNLLIVTEDWQWNLWEKNTLELDKRKPVSKSDAKHHFLLAEEWEHDRRLLDEALNEHLGNDYV